MFGLGIFELIIVSVFFLCGLVAFAAVMMHMSLRNRTSREAELADENQLLRDQLDAQRRGGGPSKP